MDLEKAFDRVPREVISWAMCKLGAEEWLVSAVMSMRVNMNKTKVMISGERQKVRQKAVRWPCGVCSKGVGSNSLQCTSCQKWVHKKRSGIKGSMSKVAK